MKKVLVFCLTLVMILSVSISAFAAGAFVSSPTGNKAPTVVEGKNESENCLSELIITAYADRDKLDAESRKAIEKAYEIISANDDLTKAIEALEKLAEEKNIKGENLAISDLFNIDSTDCAGHDEHGNFKIKLSADTLNKFVGLLSFDGQNWKLVDGAKVVDGNLIFTADVPNNFAIVVDTGANGTPQTGDNSNVYLWIMILAGSALAVVVILGLKKKNV